MINQDFASIVERDVRAADDHSIDPNTAQWLRSYEMVDGWHDELVHLLRNLEAQLSKMRQERALQKSRCWNDQGEFDQQGWDEFLATSEAAKNKKVYFKMLVENRLIEAKAIRRQRHVDALAAQVERLRSAIAEHQREVEEGVDSEEADDRLWAVVGA